MLKDFARLFQAPTACGAGGRPGQIESFVHFFKSGGGLGGRRPRIAHRHGRNSFASKRAGGGRWAGKIASRVWEPHPYTSVWMLQVCVAANLPKKVGGVPGRGFRYTSFYTRLAYVGICLFHSWLRSGRAAPTFFIAKKVGKEALKGEPLDVFLGRGRFPLENPSPVFLNRLSDNTKVSPAFKKVDETFNFTGNQKPRHVAGLSLCSGQSFR